MAIPNSGQPVKYSEIIAEFGTPNNGGLGEFRISEDVGSLQNLPLDVGVPQSGEIKFSNFYNKSLNVVVNCYSGGTEYRINAKTNKVEEAKIELKSILEEYKYTKDEAIYQIRRYGPGSWTWFSSEFKTTMENL